MKNRNERTDKQINIRFAIMVVGGMVLGGGIGFGGALLSDMYGGDIVTGLNHIFRICVPILYILSMAVAYTITFVNYRKAKTMMNTWNGEEEDMLDEVDKRLGLALEPMSIFTVCNFFFYSAMTYISNVKIPGIDKATYKAGLPIMIAGVVIFLLNMAAITIIQKKILEMTKEINPEKQGNILDTDFNKVWMDSCDEAQKQAAYEAGFRAYRTASSVCMVMWIVTLITMLLFDTGIFPSICVFVIALSLIVSYTVACHKIEQKK